MRQVNSIMILEPQLTAFQVSIIMEHAKRQVAALREDAKKNANDAASIVASIMEYDGIIRACELEKKLYDHYRLPRVKDDGKGKPRA